MVIVRVTNVKMKTQNSNSPLLSIALVFTLFMVSNGETINQNIRAVNLGGWLVAEGWMKPSLFDSIPNKDFLDGAALQFQSVTLGKFLSAELGGGNIIVANRISASDWETFRLWRIDETSFHVRVFNKQFLGIDSEGANLVAITYDSETSGIFEIIRKSDASDRDSVRIKAPNGFFLQATTEDLVTADSNGEGQWDENDPSVFKMTIARKLQGEYQVTNGYGPLLAPQIMKDHWDTYIVEEDFSFIADNGLNAVRIPVGWWTTQDPTPPKPYVGGSLEALDRAFLWADKYNLKVILDFHAAPGSQNGDDHSSTRDGFLEWGETEETIEESVRVIEFYTTRYAEYSSLYAVELLNEPRVLQLGVLERYYDAAYKVVRTNAPNAFVVLSNRLNANDPKELFPLASGMTKVVIDVHYYSLYSDTFKDMTVQDNIDYIKTTRANDLQRITTSDGPLTFVGEWVAEFGNRKLVYNQYDYQRFSEAQLQVWEHATFGWAYWSLKNVNHMWSMEWMLRNDYIILPK